MAMGDKALSNQDLTTETTDVGSVSSWFDWFRWTRVPSPDPAMTVSCPMSQSAPQLGDLADVQIKEEIDCRSEELVTKCSALDILDADEDESWFSWLRWNRTSLRIIRSLEERIFSYVRTSHKSFFVTLGTVVGVTDNKIWTIALNEDSEKVPLVLVHGFASGSALWCLNLETLAKDRPVYSFDVLGFGRSSRPIFSNDTESVEKEFVESIEAWRRGLGLDKMILLGHSFGGYLATSYAIKYGSRVQHLILADPWGFPEKTADDSERFSRLPLAVRALFKVATYVNPLPLSSLRVAGPFGPKLIERYRQDIIERYSDFVGHDTRLITDYIYHCNARYPSGEMAFKHLVSGIGWARRPMLERMLKEFPDNIPVTFIYGGNSWISYKAGQQLKDRRPQNTLLHIIEGAGHHVYAHDPQRFSEMVLEACEKSEANRPSRESSPEKVTFGWS
ncbi:unnamed protein product [Cyprideis torosa]|uniref:Uncharacterized protein n=1 Tax=Cyprideis torosa TaxID=163714 RepID=A0A7R8W8F1_9CRUS|nr:unnamed protein product [Cyprideis torosa]CAG0888529.1 unnamed protein product [Cyprideis torosa]